jgi:hypothetical protein
LKSANFRQSCARPELYPYIELQIQLSCQGKNSQARPHESWILQLNQNSGRKLRSTGYRREEDLMANQLLPPEERYLTPDQVEALDKRREIGHALLVISAEFAVIATVLLLWIGQDLVYSPGWAHPNVYYFAIVIALMVVCGIVGLVLRRGTPRLD